MKLPEPPFKYRYTGESCVAFENGRIYQVIAKEPNPFKKGKYLYRIIDESGEDYLYSLERNFEIVE